MLELLSSVLQPELILDVEVRIVPIVLRPLKHASSREFSYPDCIRFRFDVREFGAGGQTTKLLLELHSGFLFLDRLSVSFKLDWRFFLPLNRSLTFRAKLTVRISL